MEHLRRHLTFLPHGSMLLTSSAAFWFFSARILVFVMASAEAIGWSYLGYLFGQGPTRWVVALLVGIATFLVVWMVDLSLITLDRAWNEHARTILNDPQASGRGLRFRDVITFALRTGLLIASLTITAPYLAQVVFQRDISTIITSEATGQIERARDQLHAKHESLIRAKESEVAAKRADYEREVAGKGTSGRYGNGAAAKALQESVSALQGELTLLTQRRDTEFARFERLVGNWSANRDALATEYNLVLPVPSIYENRKALEMLRSRPENRGTELAIKAFLGIIFGGLLLLKLFEPSSVRLYLSDVLQQEYGRYLAGTFDDLLPATERSTAREYSISPQRLYDFLTRVWAPAHVLQEHETATNARILSAMHNMELLERIQGRIESELQNTKTEVEQLGTAADVATESLSSLNSAIEAVSADVDLFREELAGLDSDVAVLDDRSRLEYRTLVTKRLERADRALYELKDAAPSESLRVQRAESASRNARVRLSAKETELAAAKTKIGLVRDVLSQAIRDRACAVLRVDGR